MACFLIMIDQSHPESVRGIPGETTDSNYENPHCHRAKRATPVRQTSGFPAAKGSLSILRKSSEPRGRRPKRKTKSCCCHGEPKFIPGVFVGPSGSESLKRNSRKSCKEGKDWNDKEPGWEETAFGDSRKKERVGGFEGGVLLCLIPAENKQDNATANPSARASICC